MENNAEGSMTGNVDDWFISKRVSWTPSGFFTTFYLMKNGHNVGSVLQPKNAADPWVWRHRATAAGTADTLPLALHALWEQESATGDYR